MDTTFLTSPLMAILLGAVATVSTQIAKKFGIPPKYFLLGMVIGIAGMTAAFKMFVGAELQAQIIAYATQVGAYAIAIYQLLLKDTSFARSIGLANPEED